MEIRRFIARRVSGTIVFLCICFFFIGRKSSVLNLTNVSGMISPLGMKEDFYILDNRGPKCKLTHKNFQIYS